MSSALAILTYVPAGCDPKVRERLPRIMKSLDESRYPGAVAIIDDGSTDLEHTYLLGSLSKTHTVIRKKYNSGICRAKNTCIRVIKEWNVNIGFIVEDDMEFVSDWWWMKYQEAHRRTGISHFSWMWKEAGECQSACINDYPVVKRPKLNGCFLTFDRKVIERVGGFPDFPSKWGNTHINWSKRIFKAGLIPFFADIEDSNDHIRLTDLQHKSSVKHADKVLSEKYNCIAGAMHFDDIIYQPLTE